MKSLLLSQDLMTRNRHDILHASAE